MHGDTHTSLETVPPTGGGVCGVWTFENLQHKWDFPFFFKKHEKFLTCRPLCYGQTSLKTIASTLGWRKIALRGQMGSALEGYPWHFLHHKSSLLWWWRKGSTQGHFFPKKCQESLLKAHDIPNNLFCALQTQLQMLRRWSSAKEIRSCHYMKTIFGNSGRSVTPKIDLQLYSQQERKA